MSSEYLRSNPLAEHNSGIALSSKELPSQNSGTGNMYSGQAGRAFVQGGGGMSQYYSSDVGNPENAYANGSYAPVTVGYNSVTRGGRRRGSGSKRKLRRIRRTKRKVARYSRRRNKKNRIPVPLLTGGAGGGTPIPPAGGGGTPTPPAGGGLALELNLPPSPAHPSAAAADIRGISNSLGNLQIQGGPAGAGCNCDCGANSAAAAAAAADAAAAAADAAADTAEAAAASARAAAAAVLLDEANLPAEFANNNAFTCVDCGHDVMYGSPQFRQRVDLPDGRVRCGDCVYAEAARAVAEAEAEVLRQYPLDEYPNDEDDMGNDYMGDDQEDGFVCRDCRQPVIVGSREHGGRREINGMRYCGDCAPDHLDEGSSDGGMSNGGSDDGSSDGGMSNGGSDGGSGDGSGDGMSGGSTSSKKYTRSTHSKNKRKNPKSRLTKKLKMKSANNRKKRRTRLSQ